MDMNKNSEYPFVFSMIIKMEVNMLFKDDWDKSKQRLEALWNNEIIDRACISVTALKDSHNYVREKCPKAPRIYSTILLMANGYIKGKCTALKTHISG